MRANDNSIKGGGTLILQYEGETYPLQSFASGDYITLEMEGDFTSRTALYGGGAGTVRNFTGRQGRITIKVTAGSLDDQFFMKIYNNDLNNFSSSGFIGGEWNLKTKTELGDVQTRHTFKGGTIVATPTFSASVEGNIAELERQWTIGATIELKVQ